MLSRFRNPARDIEEIGRPIYPVRQDNWGTTAQLDSVLGNTLIESRDLVDVALPDDHAGPFVITLSGPDDGMLEPAAFPITRGLNAELLFGTGGSAVTVLCDWIRGQRICLHAGRVRVRALWGVPVSNSTRSINVGAFAAFGTATGHQPAQLTDFLGGLAVLAGQTVRVPYLARRAILTGTPVNVPFNVDFLDPNGAVINNYVTAAYPATVPIPGGARWVTVTNGGAVISQPRIIWELDL
jgi:hypothetical protein